VAGARLITAGTICFLHATKVCHHILNGGQRLRKTGTTGFPGAKSDGMKNLSGTVAPWKVDLVQTSQPSA